MTFEVLHRVLVGLVFGAFVNGLWWATTGHFASTSTVVALSMCAGITTDMLINRRRQRETRLLDEGFQRPSFDG